MPKPNFDDMHKQPRAKVIDGIYFDLRVMHNAIVDAEIKLRYKEKLSYEEIEKIEMELEALREKEDYLLLKLVEEKKLIRSYNN